MREVLKVYAAGVFGSQISYMIILAIIYILNIFYPEPSSELLYSFSEYVTLSLFGFLWSLQSGAIVGIILYVLSLIDKDILTKRVLIIIAAGVVTSGYMSADGVGLEISIVLAILFLEIAIFSSKANRL